MEHAVHLAAGTFIKDVSPSTSRKLMKKLNAAFRKAQDEGNYLDLDELEASLGDLDLDGEIDGFTNVENTDLSIGDVIGKVLALVTQVSFYSTQSKSLTFTQIRKSPQARAYFKKCCQKSDDPELELMLWVRTQWASLFKALDRILLLQKASHLFCCSISDFGCRVLLYLSRPLMTVIEFLN